MVDYFTDERVGMVQMRWSHINADYSLLTKVQAIMLDGHFVIEQTARNRCGGFFNFNGTAGIWRREAIEWSGGWQHDTLAEDTDLSFARSFDGLALCLSAGRRRARGTSRRDQRLQGPAARWAKGVIQVGHQAL